MRTKKKAVCGDPCEYRPLLFQPEKKYAVADSRLFVATGALEGDSGSVGGQHRIGGLVALVITPAGPPLEVLAAGLEAKLPDIDRAGGARLLVPAGLHQDMPPVRGDAFRLLVFVRQLPIYRRYISWPVLVLPYKPTALLQAPTTRIIGLRQGHKIDAGRRQSDLILIDPRRRELG